MELAELHINHKGRSIKKQVPMDVIVLRRMRIFRKINRPDAARAIERGEKVLERFENGRAPLTEEQKKALVRRYRYTWQEFLAFLDGQNELPELPPRYTFKPRAVPREEGRKYQKVVSKEARVLKVLRKMANLTQPQAAGKCGLHRSCIDHLENGRVETTPEKIAHVVRSYGFKMDLFEELLHAPMLRDEVLEECVKILSVLDNEKLRAVKALLDNFR
jgi:transcriptional regulator with XRE-family HTH domain